MNYIFDDAHKWFVCIGVPYATHYWQVADSSKLNGTYKIYLTKGKELYFLAKPPGHKGWSMTDIIPLVNYAYPLSFGMIQRGRKAIQDRGWGPLNYVLLQNADILSTKGCTATESSEPSGVDGAQDTNSSNPSTATKKVTTLNHKKDLAAEYMDGLIRETMKEDGRQEKIREKRRQEHTLVDTAKKLKEMTKVTSGGLASNGMYHIQQSVHGEVTTRKSLTMAKDADKEQKRVAREERIESNRQASRDKRTVTARSSMLKEDLMRGIAELKLVGDSPQKKNRQETEAQLQRRELRAAKEKELKGKYLSNVDIRVLLEELQTEGDGNEAALLSKSREELEAELERRRNRPNLTTNRNNVTTHEPS